MHRDDREFIYDIIEACKRIERYLKGLRYDAFLKNTEKQDAVIRNLEIIGEAVKGLSDGFKNKHRDIPWKKIAGMRDRLIHFYFGVNLEIVWIVATEEVPALRKTLRKAIKRLDDEKDL